jgi:ParB family transcriptional regulator, chromosome partitioning protein
MANVIGQLERVRALAVAGRFLAVGGVRADARSQLTLHDYIAEKTEKTIEVPAHVLGLAGEKDHVVAACSDGKLRVYDAAKGEEIQVIAAHEGAANAVAIAKDVIASVGADGFLRTFSLKSGKKQKEWTLSSRPLRAVAIEPAGEGFAAAGDDGVVRVVWTRDDSRREMNGHDGPVLSLAFTPADGRLVSGGEDGTLRIWFLIGEVEADVRGTDDSGHTGGTTAILFLPGKDANDVGQKLATSGMDGKVRIWRTGERRKPRTFETRAEPLYALGFAPIGKANVLGKLFTAGDARTLWAISFDNEANPQDSVGSFEHGFDVLKADLAAPAKPKRETAVKTLSALGEPEALELLLGALGNDKEPEIRALAAAELAAHGRMGGRKALRLRLDDSQEPVRAAALDALSTLEASSPLSPPRAALASKFPDMRSAALVAMVPLFQTSPLVAGLIAGRLSDSDANVRRVALRSLIALYPKNDTEPLRTAFERGTADIRTEALLRGAVRKQTAELSPLVGRGLDDADADVRRTAFVVSALSLNGLISWLEAKDEAFVRALGAALARVARLDDAATTDPTPEELTRARALLLGPSAPAPATLSEEQRIPLLAALACKTSDTSLRGARGLALLGDMRALGALLTISREPDAALRRDAAIALTFLEDPRAKKRLAWMLNDPDASVRDAALGCFAKLESDALSVAEAALQSSQEDIRVRGLDILIKQGRANPRAEELLADSLEDEASKVRAEAFRTLWAWHEADPLGPLDRALAARFPDLRQRAVDELDNIATKKDGALAAPALERLQKAIGDRDVPVARSAYEKTLELKGKTDADTILLAIASSQPAIRQRGATDAHRAPADRVRSELTKLLEDKEASVRIAAIESLDKLLPGEPAPLRVGLQSSYLDLRVRAAELLSTRRDESPIDPMQALLADLDLVKRLGPQIAVPLRQRAATSLANIGTPRLLRYFATDLVKDEDPIVREQAARGLSNATRRGEEGHLLDLLGHDEVAIRSWAAEGLARLGDTRALPVLTGTLRHEHPPIRIGAILSFAALGPEGYGGMLQGLEDPAREVQRIVLSVILARDLRAFRANESPDLLTSALSSQRPEVRFAAARALELRIEPEHYLAHLGEVLMPDKPERASDLEKWPSEEQRAHLMVALAEALAGERPEQRYAAAQALRLRGRPLDYFREVSRAVRPTSTTAPWVPETSPQGPGPATDAPKKGPLGFLRRLFSQGTSGQPDAKAKSEATIPAADQERLRLLAFGAYVGLLRQTMEDDEANRVRRDSIERIAELTVGGHVSVTSAMPALARALDDPNHLVRRNAFAALRKVYPTDPETPLGLALACSAADVVRAALDELATRGEAGKSRIVKALDSDVAEARKYAFELLEKLSEKGSLEPLLAALGSEHADIRIGVLERLATSQDRRVSQALGKALESDHEDLRLRAAELLAGRRDDRAADALGQALRSDDANVAQRARTALSRLGSATAVRTLAARFDDDLEEAERIALTTAIGETHSKDAIDALAARFDDESETVRNTAFSAALEIAGPRSDAPREHGKPKEKPRDPAVGKRLLELAVTSRYPEVRLAAAAELDDLDDSAADALAISLFGDRDVAVRTRAVASYAARVEKKGAAPGPLEDLVRAGARETMLAAAEGLAHKKSAAAFRPLLLFVRAGEEGERERALLGLGTLGDQRAVAELEVIAGGGTEEAPADVPMQAAALEGLGRLHDQLKDSEEKERVRDRVEGSIGTKENALAVAAVKALRWMSGERSRARIESILSSKSSSQPERQAAVQALFDIGDVASEAVLGAALDAWDVRWEARYALEKLFPDERTRIELLAVESSYPDMSGPAATFLATEGDPSLLLEKLAKLSDASLRERLRFGLVRREKIPSEPLTKLLASPSPDARADACWVIGVRATEMKRDAKTLGPALASAVKQAETAHREATRHAKHDAIAAESRAWLMALWAARRLEVEAVRTDARRLVSLRTAPTDVRIEAVRLVKGDAQARPELEAALGDPDQVLRFEAASALAAADPTALPIKPDDPVLAARSVGSASGTAALAKSIGRRVFISSVARRHSVEGLVDAATRGKGQDQLDAIGALGLVPTAAALETLGALASEDGSSDEGVRKAAFRSLRRAQRRAERQGKEAAE